MYLAWHNKKALKQNEVIWPFVLVIRQSNVRVKPLNSGHLRVLKNLSVIKRCSLLLLFVRMDLGTSQSVCWEILATMFVMKTGRKQNKILWSRDTDRLSSYGQAELSNMLLKKNVLNKINKEGTFTQGFKDCRKIKWNVSQIRRPSKLADKVQLRKSVATLWVTI